MTAKKSAIAPTAILAAAPADSTLAAGFSSDSAGVPVREGTALVVKVCVDIDRVPELEVVVEMSRIGGVSRSDKSKDAHLI